MRPGGGYPQMSSDELGQIVAASGAQAAELPEGALVSTVIVILVTIEEDGAEHVRGGWPDSQSSIMRRGALEQAVDFERDAWVDEDDPD